MKTYYFASPTSDAKKVGTSGRLFKKQILPLGDWVDPLYPGEKMTFTREYFEQMAENFKKAVAGRISVPDYHANETTPEGSRANTGEVVDLTVEDDGLYAYLDIRNQEAAEGIDRDTIWDVSAKFTDNYQDTKHGIWHGPALLHVALVNNPYIKKMNPFTALADALHTKHGAAVRALSEAPETLKEETMKVTNTKDFPVEVKYTVDEKEVVVTLAPGEEHEVPTEEVATDVNAQIEAAEAPASEETEEEKTAREAQEAADAKAAEDAEAARKAEEDAKKGDTQELSDTARELAETKHKLAMRDINDSYKELLSQGKLVPAMETSYKQLSEAIAGQSRELSDGNTVSLSEALTSFIAAMPKIVALDDERGKTDEETHEKAPWEKLSDAQREKLQASGITADSYNATGGKNGFSVADLNKKEEN